MSRIRPEPAAPPRGLEVEARKAAKTLDAGDFSYVVLDGPLGAPGAERRLGARQRHKLRSGKIVGRDGRFMCECLVHDRSASGGKLRLAGPVELPPVFYFYDDQTAQLFEVTVAWRKDRELGARIGACAPSAAHRAIAERMQRKFYALKR